MVDHFPIGLRPAGVCPPAGFFTSDRKGNGGSFGHFFIGNFRLGVVLNFMKPSLDDNSVPVVIVFVGKIRGELQHA